MISNKNLNRGNPWHWIYQSLFYLLIIILMLFSFSPMGKNIERYVGLNFLFNVRGMVEAPPGISIIGIDEQTAIDLQLPNQHAQWSRVYYAELIDRLKGYGVDWVVLYLDFLMAQSKDADHKLKDSIQESGNVILLKYIKKPILKSSNVQQEAIQEPLFLSSEQEIYPLDIFAESAIATTSLILPDTSLLDYAPLYRIKPFDVDAQLPLVLFQLQLNGQAHIESLLDSLDITLQSDYGEYDPVEFANFMHLILNSRPQLKQDLTELIHQLYDASIADKLTQLLGYYKNGEEPRVVNFYGPSRTIKTISFQDVFLARPGSNLDNQLKKQLKNNVVFIGLSELQQTEQRNAYQTYFSHDGLDLSGVEVAATLFANLQQNELLVVLKGWQQMIIMLIWVFILLRMAKKLEVKSWGICVLASSIALILLSLIVFQRFHLWLPVSILIFIITPLTMIYVFWLHYEQQRFEHVTAINALESYVPSEIIEQIESNHQKVSHLRSTVDGVCLLTDIEGYTQFSEQCLPEDLHGILNEYYQAVVKIIDQYDGRVMNIVGDGLLAIWCQEGEEKENANKACLAALDIVSIADNFEIALTGDSHLSNHQSNHRAIEEDDQHEPLQLKNRSPNASKFTLKTCVGLHSGNFSVGNLGSVSHFEYAPVGDTVNTTSRIEAYNRQLRTRILVSDRVHQVIDPDFVTRDCGDIYLKGKQKAIRLYELLDKYF